MFNKKNNFKTSMVFYLMLILLFVASFIPLIDTKNPSLKSASGNWSSYASWSNIVGSGTSSSAYLVYNAQQFAALLAGQSNVTYYIELKSDIDLSAHYWNMPTTFSGLLNGNGHTIKSLTINSSSENTGLVGELISSATIKNLYLKNVYIESNISSYSMYVGAVAGYCQGYIKQVYVSGYISGTSTSSNFSRYVGGIAGYCLNANVSECLVENLNLYNKNQKYDAYAGGIASFSTRGTISNCIVKNSYISVSNTGYTAGSYIYKGRIKGGGRPWVGYDSNQVQFSRESTNTYRGYAGGILGSGISCTLSSCYVVSNTVSSTRGTYYYKKETDLSNSISNGYDCANSNYGGNYGTHLKDNKWLGSYPGSGSYSSWYTISDHGRYQHLYDYCSCTYIGASTENDNRTYGQSISQISGSYCYTYAPTYLPTGFSSTYWAVDSKINDGKLYLKWMYWQHQI